MAKPGSWIVHVEAFMDTSRPQNQEVASIDAIVALVKKDNLSLEALVRDMELYLTTTDHAIRGRGILILAEIIARLTHKSLDSATISSLARFFTSRLSDWQALHGALIGCFALLRRKNDVVSIASSDARVLAQSFLLDIPVQSLKVDDRKLCYEILQCLLDRYPEALATLDVNLCYGICQAIDGEKDPHCLMLAFHLVEILVRLSPDPFSSSECLAGDLFEILGRYFPVYFTHPRSHDFDVKRDDLSRALMNVFCSTPHFEPFAIPLLLDKLSSSLQSAKLDSLRYLNSCMLRYGSDRMSKHAKPIWSALKDVIFNFSPEELFLHSAGSAQVSESHENETYKEAQICLQTLVSQYSVPNDDTVLSLIVEDEDIKNIVGFVSSAAKDAGIPKESKRQLSAVGSILSVSSKVSSICCDRVFQQFIPLLMNGLGVPAISYCGSITNYNTFSEALNLGALYLSVQLLASSRDLAVSALGSSPQLVSPEGSWLCMLQDILVPLTNALRSTLPPTGNSVVLNEEFGHELVCYGVKGLQVLSTYPACYSPMSQNVYEDILTLLTSMLTDRSEDTYLWRLSLKALAQIGSFIDKFHDSEKAMSYSKVVVAKLLALLSLDDSTISLALKLEAIFFIGSSGLVYMLAVTQALEEAIFANLLEACVNGQLKSAEILGPLLRCYSNQVLPWYHSTVHFEEVAVRFAVKIWNQMETMDIVAVDCKRQDLMDAASTAMKLAVTGCTEEKQALIVQKAYDILLSKLSLSLKEILHSSTSNLEDLFPLILKDFSSKDEWLISLFASVLIALRQQTPIPDVRIILKFLLVCLLKGDVSAAQALASMINKLPEKTAIYSLDEAIDEIFEIGTSVLGCTSPLVECTCTNNNSGSHVCLSLQSDNSSLQVSAVHGLAWIGKGLLMRGHEKIKEITMLLLECLLPSRGSKIKLLDQPSSDNRDEKDLNSLLARSVANAFHVLLGDSDSCLNKRFHATIRTLHKQRFFASMMPVLLSLIKESAKSSVRALLYRAFAHLISDTPLPAVILEAKKVIPSLMSGLCVLSQDVRNKDLTYSLLLVLSGLLMDENGKAAILDNIHDVICHLVRLISYPHMMLVRETAIQCLVAMSGLPYAKIYPMRLQVIRSVSSALDDKKRAVREEAVRCRQAWASIASRSLHF